MLGVGDLVRCTDGRWIVRPAAGVVVHVVIGIEGGNDTAQHFPHLLKASKRGLNIDFSDRDNGGRCAPCPDWQAFCKRLRATCAG